MMLSYKKSYSSATKALGGLAVATSAALLLASCGGGSSSPTTTSAPTGTAAYIRTTATPPGTPFLPGLARDEGANAVLGSVLEGLVDYDRHGKMIMAAAESVTTKDNKVWTIKVRKGWSFTDGEKMTAKNFVDAWNYIADSEHHQTNLSTIEYISGYSPTLKGPLSGVKLIDDYTIQVTLIKPLYDFPDRLTDVSMLPLPESAFKDMDAYGKHPIGQGPYILVSYRKGISVEYRANPDYKGSVKPKNAGVIGTIYQSPETAYADYLAGNLDLAGPGPSDLTHYKKDSDGRYIEKPTNSVSLIAIPKRVVGFGLDEAGILRRRAVSMAIDRESIIKEINHGLGLPASGYLPPTIFPDLQNVEGADNTKYNLEEAKKLWAQAQSISPLPANYSIKYYYSGDGGGAPVIEAIVHMLHHNLGLNIVGSVIPTFSQYVAFVQHGDGFLSIGWNGGMTPSGFIDYNLLSKGRYNLAKWDNPRFDELNSQALAEVDAGKRTKIWRQMLSIAMQQLPDIPLFYQEGVTLWSTKVKNIETDVTGSVIVGLVEKI